jgi:CheY-like chemotaxis protein
MGQLKRILHVEDEPDIREIASIGLSEVAGYAVVSCGTPAEAFDAVRGNTQPDLLLLDVMMPEMDGPELLSKLRDMPGMAETPAVFVTAKTEAREIEPLLEAGAIGIVPKPFDPMTVGQTIQEMWDQHVGSQ